ncbi:DUF1778 domain-containing protein [Actimicrobium sp. CCI2.3]|uniref:type II toxin-antitoxin system TacA family antitoxin n=1 Tax=Actimicrobium sp. CCI2.3 TaxID=3048616 RepID=UPI002AB36639|nr:DUF1778 domain-containing protein [Actimicrobium sp. CCI2.3]MDY7574836.1 DUF1778 domain-containing protein [Actimicrobium sp. CCI2.3]MEB0020203.1 DUF1778 domain-containing protein [Actimicrobium sp. CCI2.3]
MTTLNDLPNKRESLNIRIKPKERSLIDRAVTARGKNRTDFILDAARLAGEEVLIGQELILARPTAHAEFVTILDRPPNPNARLRKTLQTLPPWEHS